VAENGIRRDLRYESLDNIVPMPVISNI